MDFVEEDDFEVSIPSKDTNPEFESDAQQHSSPAEIPEGVLKFIVYFYERHRENSLDELKNLYDNSFNRLTDKFYKGRAWPVADEIAAYLDLETNDIFLTLYRELYYRDIYSRLKTTLTLQQRIESYQNYHDLFQYILQSEESVDLQLPIDWLWDMIDEFIYQFQAFNQYRQSDKSEEEATQIKKHPEVWSYYGVLSTLNALIAKSHANEQFSVSKTGNDTTEAIGKYSGRPLHKMLSHFSVVGLLRVHCLFGDYTVALKAIDSTMLNYKKSRVRACHVTTYYYVGYAYLMMRRYADAIKVFTGILPFIQRMKQQHLRSKDFNQIVKKGDRIYALLAICYVLCPTRLDESIYGPLFEKHRDELHIMEKGEEGTIEIYRKLWKQGNPFENQAEKEDTNPAAEAQEHVFLADIRHQIKLPALRSFMKLYTSMGVEKLAKFLEMPVDDLRVHLLTLKQRSRQYRWSSGDLLEGDYVPTSDLDFCLKQDVLYIAESKIGRRFADWFLRNINRCEEILKTLEVKA